MAVSKPYVQREDYYLKNLRKTVLIYGVTGHLSERSIDRLLKQDWLLLNPLDLQAGRAAKKAWRYGQLIQHGHQTRHQVLIGLQHRHDTITNLLKTDYKVLNYE